MIQIVEENEFFLVLTKPSGTSVHNQKPSLVEFLTAEKKPLHFVNRLDQETSGLMIVAQTPALHEALAESLQKGQKFYRTLLRGTWKKPEKEVVLNWPLTDKAEGHRNPQGLTQDRVPCETRLHILRTNKYFTEAQAEIKTGRQHQIRKHTALLQFPVVGDNRYNDASYNERIAQLYGPLRLQLHAEKLIFNFREKNYEFENRYDLERFFTE